MSISSLKARRGFTLVELLVVIAIIGTLVAILLPSLASARATANASASASNMSSFGRAFELIATNDANGAYGTGAFDHARDGDVRSYGWVADVISSKVGNPGKGLDPGSKSKVNEKVADYCNAKFVSPDKDYTDCGVPAGRWATASAATNAGTAYFTVAGLRDTWNNGYNSNYATTWHFSRGDPSTAAVAATNPSAAAASPATGWGIGKKGPIDGNGPLTQNDVAQAACPGARIAFMGPARNGDGNDARVTTAAAGVSRDTINNGVGKPIVKVGDFLVESFCDGMTVGYTNTLIGGAPNRTIHEFNDIEPLHLKKGVGGGFAPILFADLHVAKVFDSASYNDADGKGDGYIGNGVTRDANGKITDLNIDAPTYSEIADFIWVKRLTGVVGADGSVNE